MARLALAAGVAVAAPGLPAAADLESCTELLFEPQRSPDREERLMACRVPLLGALTRDQIPGYSYNATEDCHFWARYAARDRSVEGSRLLDFNRLAALRLSEPFAPPLRQNGTALYVGAHRGGEDGLFFHQRHGLRMHLFEPSRTFFRSLQQALGGLPGLTLHNYGLGARSHRAQLRLSGTASRTLELGRPGPPQEETEEVLIRSAAEALPEALAEHGGGGVELLHVNCEGCEYDVVEGLRRSGQLPRVAQVQVATHLLEHTGPAASFREALELSLQASVLRYCEMHRALAETHERAWGLPWVWERWTRRGAAAAAG